MERPQTSKGETNHSEALFFCFLSSTANYFHREFKRSIDWTFPFSSFWRLAPRSYIYVHWITKKMTVGPPLHNHFEKCQASFGLGPQILNMGLLQFWVCVGRRLSASAMRGTRSSGPQPTTVRLSVSFINYKTPFWYPTKDIKG